jgi:thiol-disulfide isomerase/thioredoxin/tetratricopeptide (TPR) repeat protein
MRVLLSLALVLPVAAQPPTVPCEASAATLRLLEALPPMRESSIPYEQRIGALRRLAAQHAEDFFIQRAYQDSFRRQFYLADEYDRALAMYRKRTSDPLSKYYEARLLMMAEPRQSRSTLETLIKTHPGFVWPHLDFLEWTMLPGRRDPEEATTHWKAFLAVCPAPLDGRFDTALINDKEILRQLATDLRQGLERRNSPLDFPQLPGIWTLEQRAGTPSETLQARVRNDLKRIEEAPLRPAPELSRVYREAARILNDESLPARLRERVMREAPNSTLAYTLMESEWSRRNPLPARDASPDVIQAYQKKREAAELEWVRQWPNTPTAILSEWIRINRFTRNGDPAVLSTEDLAVIDRTMEYFSTSPEMVMWPPLETVVARLYVTARVRLDQVPQLLDAGLAHIRKQEKYRISEELVPAEMRAHARDNPQVTWAQYEPIRADYLLAVKRTADARAIIEAALNKLDTAPPGRVEFERREWLRRLGDADAQDGNVESALTHYQQSLSRMPREVLDRASARGTTGAIKRYYLAHGGTSAKWLEWAAAKVPVQPRTISAQQFNVALPSFSAKDLTGRNWTLHDLKGKVTFVNLWATWCGPCRAEHPSIQKLFESLETDPKAQVLTISVDEDPAAVRSYMKDEGYSFPVIQAQALADRLMPYAGLPTNFLVNPSGRRTAMYPFSGDPASLERLRKDIQDAGVFAGVTEIR